jgi:DedD protein
MNPELRQRLIGAVVVTALAAIFIPMLFDDPVDNSGQSVSELVIPATPVNTGEESANKLPGNANQVLNAPDSGLEEEKEFSPGKQAPAESLGAEPEAEAEGITPPQEEPVDEAANDDDSGSLDTGVIDETVKPAKTKKTPPTAETFEPEPSQEPEEAIVPTPKKPAKKTETSAHKQAAKVKPPVTAVEKPVVKPAKPASELNRWIIQAGTFSKKENAQSLMETLRKQGMPVTMEATKGMYRLKVGPSLDKKRAMDMKAKLDSQKIPSILIAE